MDSNGYLFNIPANERERVKLVGREPARLETMKFYWEGWNTNIPSHLGRHPQPGYSFKGMQQRQGLPHRSQTESTQGRIAKRLTPEHGPANFHLVRLAALLVKQGMRTAKLQTALMQQSMGCGL